MHPLAIAAILSILDEVNASYVQQNLQRVVGDWHRIFGEMSFDERELNNEDFRLYVISIFCEARKTGGGDPYRDHNLREARRRVRQRSV